MKQDLPARTPPEELGWMRPPARVPPPLCTVRPEPSDYPAIQLVEELSDVGPLVVVAPTSHHGVDLIGSARPVRRGACRLVRALI